MLRLDYQTENAPKSAFFPEEKALLAWLEAALSFFAPEDLEIVVRVVENEEIQALNRDYRGKDYATNVLSFPFETDEALAAILAAEGEVRLLGDLVIAAEVVNAEALAQGKSNDAHWAHIAIHGLLHLLGYDHIEDKEAEEMEALERDILAQLGYPDPYDA